MRTKSDVPAWSVQLKRRIVFGFYFCVYALQPEVDVLLRHLVGVVVFVYILYALPRKLGNAFAVCHEVLQFVVHAFFVWQVAKPVERANSRVHGAVQIKRRK